MDCRGYFGATFDGRYVYYAPQHTEKIGDSESWPASGRVLRHDTHSPCFADPSAFESYDAGRSMGMETKGFYGAAFDGRYVIFVPRQAESGYNSRVLRFDTMGDFASAASWDVHEFISKIDAPAHSSQGAAMTANYLYLSPGFYGNMVTEEQRSPHVIRWDRRRPFHAPSSWQDFDLSQVPIAGKGAGGPTAEQYGGVRAHCFDGACTDGRFVYLVPLGTGVVVRHDSACPLDEGWEAFDAGSVCGSNGT
eukprot:SAG11_NODE_4657_length_1819_cov_1.291279_2_plen_250_part_00